MIKRRSKPRRVSVARDPKYLAFLRSEGHCVVCYKTPADPAHGPVNGSGSKGSDLEALPLCRTHHNEQEALGGSRIGWARLCQRYAIDRKAQILYWNLQYKEMTNDESSK